MNSGALSALAASNNADWYAMMFDIHGLKYNRTTHAFLGLQPPPPYHSWMTTLVPGSKDRLTSLISQNIQLPGFGLKDSFDCLDLESMGLVELFSANWIYADSVRQADTSAWVRINNKPDLLSWEHAWKHNGSPSNQRQFPDQILDRPDVIIWGRRQSQNFDAGAVANFSTGCIGISNFFGSNALSEASTLCAELTGNLPIVGYAREGPLSEALSAGFRSCGRLRVWV